MYRVLAEQALSGLRAQEWQSSLEVPAGTYELVCTFQTNMAELRNQGSNQLSRIQHAAYALTRTSPGGYAVRHAVAEGLVAGAHIERT